MKQKVLNYIEENHLFSKNDKILLGISGGRDSVSLLYILKDLKYNVALAHCNFQLRGKASDEDEQFVLELAKTFNIEIFNTRFDTETISKKKGISIQMAARELRYNWFEDIRKKHSYDCIAIAHNQDDMVETFFINLIRGTGIEGLSGIKTKNNWVVRPFLAVSREEINAYIKDQIIVYREDASNASTKYIRNKLRHIVLPELRSISKAFDQTMVENMDRIRQVKEVYENEISNQKSKTLIQLSDKIKISIEHLNSLKPLYPYLYEYLKPYGFSASTIRDIEESISAEPGKKFFSKTHQLVKDRDGLILSLINKKQISPTFFTDEDKELKQPISIKIEQVDINDFKLSTKSNIAALDMAKLKFPLQIRLWQYGDFFMPLGMNRMKKLSDFLIDNKVSLIEKESAFVVQSKNDIVWLVGRRIDERYKITEQTKKVLILTLKND